MKFYSRATLCSCLCMSLRTQWYEYRVSDGGDEALSEPIVSMLEKSAGVTITAYCSSCSWTQRVFPELLQSSVGLYCLITQNTLTFIDSESRL
jgi:hypothetical protein